MGAGEANYAVFNCIAISISNYRKEFKKVRDCNQNSLSLILKYDLFELGLAINPPKSTT